MRRNLQISDNKYSRGVVAIVAGSPRFPGAAILAVGGARRGNAGYVKFASANQKIRDLVVQRFPDVVPIPNLKNERIDALVVGPGSARISQLPKALPVILDSSAITLAKRPRAGVTVITPHEGELKYLGLEVGADRLETAIKLAKQFEVFVVLKGHKTVIASPDGRTYLDKYGGPELATAGSGDVLAGLIGSFLVSVKDGADPFKLVCDAVELHSRAGNYAAKKFTSVTAVEIMESLANV